MQKASTLSRRLRAPSAARSGTFFQAIFDWINAIYQFPLTDFAGFGGDILVTSESNGRHRSRKLRWSVAAANYVTTFFDNTLGATRAPLSLTATAFLHLHQRRQLQRQQQLRRLQQLQRLQQQRQRSTPTATATATPTATATATATPTPTPTPTVTPPTCGTGFAIGDLDAVVGNQVTFWGAQWWKNNHLSGGRAPASFKGFVNCTNPNPPACGGTWTSDPGNSGHPPDTVPADITVIVSSSITKSGPVESGDIPKIVTVHTDPRLRTGNPGHEGTGTVTAVICVARPHQPGRPARPDVHADLKIDRIHLNARDEFLLSRAFFQDITGIS